MVKFQMSRPGAPWDYPTLKFTATADGAILDGTLFEPDLTIPPDAYWSSYPLTGSVVAATDLFTTTAAHGLAVNNPITLSGSTAGGTTDGTTYYVKTVPTSTTFTISATVGGATLDVTSDDTSMTIYGGGPAETSITRYGTPAPEYLTPIVETPEGNLLVYSQSANTYVSTAPATAIGSTTPLGTALSASYARVAGVAAATQVQATDTANIAAAIATLPTTGAVVGGTVYLPPGQWLINAPLSLLRGLHFKGSGKAATEIRVQTGSMFAPTASIGLVTFEDLTLSTTAGHLFNFGATGGLYESKFVNCNLVTYANAASLFHQDGTGNIVEVVWDNCELVRPTLATVSAFNLKNSAGALNANEWRNCRPIGNNCASTPFFYLEGTLAAYAHHNKFKGIVGHQNRAGLIHVGSPNGLTLEDVQDWDATGNYVDHLVKVFTSATTGGKVPRFVKADLVGTPFGVFDAGKYEFHGPTVPDTPYLLSRIGKTTGAGTLPYFVGQSVSDAWGACGSVNFVTGSLTLDIDVDGTVVFNGASLTATLPTAGAVPYAGRRFTIKNIHSTALTVNAAGAANVDGAASQSLAQWVAKTYVTDGAAWFSV